VHELVQSTVLANNFRARPQHQVKRVTEDDVGTVIGDLLGRDTLDRAVSADWHECRRPYVAAPETQRAATCSAGSTVNLELHDAPSGVTNMESP
jgi:hypothetical protein